MSFPIYCQNLSKNFRSESGSTTKALVDVSFSVKGGEFLTIVGPSGCGKSTLLKLIAGVEQPDAGTVSFGDQGLDARIGLVFQSSSVFPWRTVEKNLTYALEVNGTSKIERVLEA